jgi:light-regulated signal transduction histidine kinase (bacteriophytochrome)
LAESNRDLEQFAMIASHDLQSPLRKIQIFCEQIYRDAKDKLKPESLDLMQRVDRSITTAQTLVHDLLTLSKVIKPVTHSVK